MVLTLKKQNAFNENQITIEFDEKVISFYEFEQIFRSLRELDSICENFLDSKNLKDSIEIDVHSEIKSLSKNSPFELSAFVTEHWFEIFLFIWGSYDRIRPNAGLIYRDLVDLTETIESNLNDIGSDLRTLDYEKLDEVLNWFNNLPFMERARIARLMIKQSRIFKKISKIMFNRN